MASSQVLSAVILALQSIPLAAGSYGGVTGLDSVQRGICALVDQTIGPLLLYGLINLSYPDLHIPKSNLKLRMARTSFIHTEYEPEQRSAGVDYRANWLDIGSTISRSGRFRVRWSNGGLKSAKRLENGEPQLGPVHFAPNSNQWIYPYLLGKEPREAGKMVSLSRDCLIQTAALTIARFGIFLASSILFTTFHILIILLLFDDKFSKFLLVLGDIGRWLLVVGQLSSVLTYSLDYKGICSWAAPKDYYGTRWTRREQIQCQKWVLHYMGNNYHARLVFHTVAWLWPRISARFGQSLFWEDFFGDRDIFSSFRCFSNEEFLDENSTLLRLTVGEKLPGETSIDYKTSYYIDFKVPTQLFQFCLNNRLTAEPTQRKYNFRIMAPLCICSILAPFVLIWRDGQSSHPVLTLIVSSFFQIVTMVFNYKDADDWSINCRFQSIPQAIWSPPPASSFNNVVASGSTGRSHVYPPIFRGSASSQDDIIEATSTTRAATVTIPVKEQDVTEAIDRKGKSKAVN